MIACAIWGLNHSSWSSINPSNLCMEEGEIVTSAGSSGCLVSRCVLPCPLESFSLFLVKSISCKLAISKKEL